MKKQVEPLVSIVMATYKTEKDYLNKSIKSILTQSYRNIEFIIVCDGDKDEYEYINKNYYDSKLRIILNEKNEGLAKSLNKGIKISRGKYIARMDSDDVSLRNRIKEQVKYMERHKEINICSMYAKCIGDVNLIKGSFYIKPQEIDVQLLFTNCIIHPSVLIRKKFLLENRITYNEDYICSQDYELWSRISNCNMVILKKIGLLYRVHKSQVSNSKSEIQRQLRKEIVKNRLKGLGYEDNDILNTFYVLADLKKMDLNNYISVSNNIDKFVKNEKNNISKYTKKILYNRYFQIFLNNRISIMKFGLYSKDIRKKILNVYNVNYLFFVIKNRIKSYFFSIFIIKN